MDNKLLYLDYQKNIRMHTQTNLMKFLIGMTFLMFFCSLQIGIAQVPVSPKEIPPPPPPPEPSVEEIFQVVEEIPLFPGCENKTTNQERKKCMDEKMLQYIYANLKYPKVAVENGIEGTVVISFYVDKDGSINEPRVLRDIGAGCGKEALRVVKSMENVKTKKWTPGKPRGRPVKVQFNLPVKFDLDMVEKKKD